MTATVILRIVSATLKGEHKLSNDGPHSMSHTRSAGPSLPTGTVIRGTDTSYRHAVFHDKAIGEGVG